MSLILSSSVKINNNNPNQVSSFFNQPTPREISPIPEFNAKVNPNFGNIEIIPIAELNAKVNPNFGKMESEEKKKVKKLGVKINKENKIIILEEKVYNSTSNNKNEKNNEKFKEFQRQKDLINKKKKLIPLNIMSAYKFIALFAEILKLHLIYKNYKNLNKLHLNIIHDISVDKKTLQNLSKYFNGRSTIIFKNFCSTNIFYILSKKIKEAFTFLPIISCNNKINFIWNFIILVCSFYLIITIPLVICFDLSLQKESIFLEIFKINENFVVILFLMDIFVNFNLSYYEHGNEIKTRKKIMINYVKSGFFFDFFSTLVTFIYMSMFASDSFFQICILLKALSFTKNFNFFQQIVLSNIVEGIIQIFILMIKILYIAHILACIFNLLSNTLIENRYFSTSWLIDSNLMDADWLDKYINAYYWAITTLATVGYGDIAPKNNIEKLYCMSVMLLGGGIFAYNINKLSSIFGDISKNQREYMLNLKILNQMMKRKNLNSELQNKVRNYFHYINKTENKRQLEQENELCLKLSDDLQKEIILNSNAAILKQSKFLCNNFSEEFLQQIVFKMKAKLYTPDEIIFEDFEINPCLYFITQGEVKLIYDSKLEEKKEKIIYLMHAGETLGEKNLLSHEENKLICKSNGFSYIYSISKKDFLYVLERFPTDREKFFMIKDSINFYQSYEILGKKCKLCNSILHLTEKCNFVIYKPYKHKIIANHIQKIKLSETKRKAFKRREAKRNYKLLEETSFSNDSVSSANQIKKENYATLENIVLEKLSEHSPIVTEIGFDKLNNSSIYMEEQEKRDESLDHHEMESHFKKEELSRKSKKEKTTTIENNFFDFKFDVFKSFKNYFPQYNFNKVCLKQKIFDANVPPKIILQDNYKSQRRGTKKLLFKADPSKKGNKL